jgi:hypothetical protein
MLDDVALGKVWYLEVHPQELLGDRAANGRIKWLLGRGLLASFE